MKQEKDKKRKYGLIYLLLFCLVVVIAILYLQNTMAQYITTGQGTGTAEVALWNVEFQGDEGTFGETINMRFTTSSSNTNVVSGKIAPSLSAIGTGVIRLTGTETAVKYSIDAEIPAEYAGLDLTITKVIADGEELNLSEEAIVLLPGGNAFQDSDDIDLEIEVTWVSDGDGSVDTPIGIAGEDLEIPITVTVEQYI